LAISAATVLSQAGITNVWLAGNHDVIEDGSGETTLEPLRALGVRRSTWVFDRPEWTGLGPVGVPVEEGTIPCLVLPFVASSHAVDLEEFVRSTWAKAIEGCRLVVVLEHLHVRGAVPGEESDEMARGREVVYPRELLEQIAKESGVELVQLGGHYHRRQRIGGLQIVGAPARFTFGERENDPGFVIVEVPS
jgi:DNA repair exonuclease SbcCD nuclease subunit